MIESGFPLYLVTVIASAIIVVAVLFISRRFQMAFSNEAECDEAPDKGAAVFLFRSGILQDANPIGLERIGPLQTREYTWANLHDALADDFADFPTVQGTDQEKSCVVLRSSDSQGSILAVIHQEGSDAKVVLRRTSEPLPSHYNPSSLAISEAPSPIWQIDKSGQVVWHNSAYKSLAKRVGITPVKDKPIFDIGLRHPYDEPLRTAVTDKSHDRTYWFDIIKVAAGDRVMCYASDANAIVNAELAQRNFVQTLTKTFAQLSIGLAIFDRNRQLALFNPALIDLTSLPADFLSGRPSLVAFFDKMRENRVMPEPKNYASWREQIAELVVAATDGRYAETWTLPSGLTYRVTGRPHPDGAIAFLFEDISAEISLTRRFRADLDLNQSVLDALPGAVAVFSAAGNLCLCNKAYRTLWNTDPDTSFAEYTLRDALPVWQNETRPSDVWARLQASITSPTDRTEWEEPLFLTSGQEVRLAVKPVDRGTTMVLFQTVATVTRPVSEPALTHS